MSTSFSFFSFFPYINNQQFISLITSTIDIFVAIIIAVSVIQAIFPIINTVIKSLVINPITFRRQQQNKEERLQEQTTEDKITQQKQSMIKKNFIRGLLLALELESANAILKMGIFTSLITQSSPPSSLSDFNNFIFFIALLSLRIAINQTLRRFNMT